MDDFHGTLVHDPFRPLEEPDHPEARAWTEKQNEITEAYLRRHPAYQKIKDRLTQLWNFRKVEQVWATSGRYFYLQNDGLLNQPQLFMQDRNSSDPRLIKDPNQWSSDGTAALMDLSFSKDPRYMAYTRAQSGSDWNSIHIYDLKTGVDLPEVINYTKFPSIAWHPDSSGFFYNGSDQSIDLLEQERQPHKKIYWHKLHTDPSEDELVYENQDEPDLRFLPFTSDDGKYLLFLEIRGGDQRNGYLFRGIDGGKVQRILGTGHGLFEYVGSRNGHLLFHSFVDAPLGKIVAVDPEAPDQSNWVEVIPEAQHAIIDADGIDDKIIVVYSVDAYHEIHIFDSTGKLADQIELPTMGTVTLFKPDLGSKEFLYSFTSFLYPPTVYHYDLGSKETSVFFQPDVDFDFDAYETTQQFYTSVDGTRVPIFLTHKKDLEYDADNPTILYGYGGFNQSQNPFFNVWNLVWIEMGGVFALANLRGGSEYGEPWHEAGMLEKKQNVFDDFISAAEWLIDKNITSPSRLAIEGRSNGGLLVSAVMIQRPELYGAVLCHVPVTDMLRYHRFTVGHFWVPEYGNAEEDPEHFDFLYRYSPLHNVQPNTEYPPIIVTTADTDDRVVPSHAKKFIATLQNNYSGDNPMLLRVESKAGHKLGKPTYKIIEERVDVWTFAVDYLNMEVDL